MSVEQAARNSLFTGIQSALKLHNPSAGGRERVGWPTLKIVFEQKEHFAAISTRRSLSSRAAALGVLVGSDSSARSSRCGPFRAAGRV